MKVLKIESFKNYYYEKLHNTIQQYEHDQMKGDLFHDATCVFKQVQFLQTMQNYFHCIILLQKSKSSL